MEFRKIAGVDTIEMYYGQLSMERDGMSYLYRAPALLDSSDLSDEVWLSTNTLSLTVTGS
jgi:hypothetical protein